MLSLQTGIRLVLPLAEQWDKAQIALEGLQIGLPVTAGAAEGGQKVAARSEARITGQIEAWPGREMRLPGVSLPLLKAELKLGELDLAPLVASLPPTALSGQVRLDGQQFMVDLSQRVERMRALLPAELQGLAADAQVRAAGT